MNLKMPDLKIEISSGNNMSVINWLQKNIFSFGRYYDSSGLCKIATGEILNPSYFIQYAKDKFYDIYKK
jgi:carboxypeptidase Taq